MRALIASEVPNGDATPGDLDTEAALPGLCSGWLGPPLSGPNSEAALPGLEEGAGVTLTGLCCSDWLGLLGVGGGIGPNMEGVLPGLLAFALSGLFSAPTADPLLEDGRCSGGPGLGRPKRENVLGGLLTLGLAALPGPGRGSLPGAAG